VAGFTNGPIKANEHKVTNLSAQGFSKEGFFKASDGIKLHYFSKQVEQPKYQIIGVHGLGEHSGRYAWFADQIAADGGTCSFLDLRGHGLSEGSRGHSPSYAQLIDDLRKFVALEIQDQIPSFFFGHSLGGGLALSYALELSSSSQSQNLLSGFIAASPLLRLSFEPPAWKLFLARILVQVWPGFRLDRGIDVVNLTRDEDIRAIYLADPLNHELVSAALTLGFLRSGEAALEHASDLQVPTLILHGEADQVTDWQASQEFALEAGDVAEFQSFAGCRHELVNELNREEVVDSITKWIQKEIST
jgi:alpha-beta hydrolase superfamily lysophospholipase